MSKTNNDTRRENKIDFSKKTSCSTRSRGHITSYADEYRAVLPPSRGQQSQQIFVRLVSQRYQISRQRGHTDATR